MRFAEIMKLPYSDKDPRPTGEVVRDDINALVREGGHAGGCYVCLQFMLPFTVPDHEIGIEDLVDLVAVDVMQFAYISNKDEMNPPKTANELVARFVATSKHYAGEDA